VQVSATSVAFTQYAAAAGRLRWTLDLSFYPGGKQHAGKPSGGKRSAVKVHKPLHLATSNRTIAKAGAVRVRLKLGSTARTLLKRYGAARLVLRTTLTLNDHRVIRATKTPRRSS
jgi:hypothetical protein